MSNKWHDYEMEKRKIKTMNLSSEEYDKAIQELTERLKV